MIKRIAFISFIGIIIIFLTVELFAYYVSLDRPVVSSSIGASNLNELIRKNRTLRKGITGLSPKGFYIVIDTARNLIFLKEGNRTILKAVVSSGSGNILRDPSGKREWIFDTPRGEFEVKEKISAPKWIKPDWAFIEEEEDIPKNWEDRVEEGVLGDYALAFGNGYFIHGTLYKRLLGRNVTHGCIRVGDEDLETIYKLSRLGTKIYIF
jgi:lipoprotein-anchoring transpeptidase ErfK/SrfK